MSNQNSALDGIGIILSSSKKKLNQNFEVVLGGYSKEWLLMTIPMFVKWH
jgi:hypothetical protein